MFFMKPRLSKIEHQYFFAVHSYLNFLVGAVDHSDQHVEKNHHHGDVINSVQNVTDVFDELMIILQNHRNHLRQTKYGPEKSLKALLNPVNKHRAEEHYCSDVALS